MQNSLSLQFLNLALCTGHSFNSHSEECMYVDKHDYVGNSQIYHFNTVLLHQTYKLLFEVIRDQ